jgi:hypothetical protein
MRMSFKGSYTLKIKPGMVAHIYNPSCVGGRGESTMVKTGSRQIWETLSEK